MGKSETGSNNKRAFADETESSSCGSEATVAKRTKNDAVEALLANLNEEWKLALKKHFSGSSFSKLAKFVSAERDQDHKTIYPSVPNTWTALNACRIDEIKVIIVGQDPYHGPNQAHGLCFSVLPGQAVPPSLKNVYKELSEDPKIHFTIPDHGHLLRWAEQGVLLLNTVMTVQKGQANSHKSKGWEETTDAILRTVVKQSPNVVFLLWGLPARKKGQAFLKSHTVICTSHPSPLGARKTNAPFLGSRCFSKCNDALLKMGRDPIDWNLPESCNSTTTNT